MSLRMRLISQVGSWIRYSLELRLMQPLHTEHQKKNGRYSTLLGKFFKDYRDRKNTRLINLVRRTIEVIIVSIDIILGLSTRRQVSLELELGVNVVSVERLRSVI